MKVTIKKIAEIAGVHPSTVDKVLHNRPGVSDEVRERIRKLIDELGYKPNPAGRVLQKQGKEFVIAAILVKVDALPYIKEGIEKGIREQTGLDITVHWYLSSYSDAGQQAQFIDKVVEEKADGIILSPINSDRVREAINRAAAAGIPLVTANSDIDGTQRLCYVGQDGAMWVRTAGGPAESPEGPWETCWAEAEGLQLYPVPSHQIIIPILSKSVRKAFVIFSGKLSLLLRSSLPWKALRTPRSPTGKHTAS